MLTIFLYRKTLANSNIFSKIEKEDILDNLNKRRGGRLCSLLLVEDGFVDNTRSSPEWNQWVFFTKIARKFVRKAEVPGGFFTALGRIWNFFSSQKNVNSMNFSTKS